MRAVLRAVMPARRNARPTAAANDYDKDVYNGDIGFVRAIDADLTFVPAC